MKNQVQELNKNNSLKLNLTKVENKNTYNYDNSVTDITINNESKKGLFNFIIEILLFPFKLISRFLLLLYNKLNPKYIKYTNTRNIILKRRKHLKKMNTINKLEDNEIF